MYLKNLWDAIIGNDPTYRKRYLKQVVETESLQQRVSDLINLTDNLQSSLHERDRIIYGLREDQRDTLRLLQQSNNELVIYKSGLNNDSREALAQTMLEKTNTSINNLLTAIKSGDIHILKECLVWMEWNRPLQEIADYCYTMRLRLDAMIADDDENPNHE